MPLFIRQVLGVELGPAGSGFCFSLVLYFCVLPLGCCEFGCQ